MKTKRKITAIVLCMALILTSISWVFAAGFTDITDPEVYISVETLKGLGVINGTSADEFSPESTITRAQACAIMIRMMGLTGKLNTYAKKTLFNDVKAGAWYTSYVNLAYDNNIVNGYGNGYFGPDDPLTYGQIATMILRLLGYTTSDIGNIWPYDYTDFCEDEGISSGLDLDPMDEISRGDTAVMFYRALSASTKQGKTYYSTTSCVSSVSNGIAYNQSGDEAGFLADSTDFKDITIAAATASQLTDTDGNKYRITGNARVINGTSSTVYTSGGYVQANANAGERARIYYNASGNISYVYIMSISEGEDENELGYKVQGYISSASPSISAATSITLAGHTFTVDESALSSLSNYKVGSKVTLILADDKSVIDVKSASEDCEMIGILAENGKSVTLADSEITLSASTMKYDTSSLGYLVTVNMSDKDTIRCTAVSSASNYKGTLDIENFTYNGEKISAYCSIYEGLLSGSVYSLEGEKLKASHDLSAIFWTDKLENVYAKYIHYDEYGQIDILVLKDVTGNLYSYGNGTYTENGIRTSSTFGSSSEDCLSFANADGKSDYYYNGFTEEGFLGIGLRATSSNTMRVTGIKELSSFYYVNGQTEICERDDVWYIIHDGTEYRISDNLQVYQKNADKWSEGADALTALLSDNYGFVFYYDKAPSEGGQIRIAAVN